MTKHEAIDYYKQSHSIAKTAAFFKVPIAKVRIHISMQLLQENRNRRPLIEVTETEMKQCRELILQCLTTKEIALQMNINTTRASYIITNVYKQLLINKNTLLPDRINELEVTEPEMPTFEKQFEYGIIFPTEADIIQMFNK